MWGDDVIFTLSIVFVLPLPWCTHSLYNCHQALNQAWTVANGSIFSQASANPCMSNTPQHGPAQVRLVNVYSSAASIELFLNETSLGRQHILNPGFGSPSYGTWSSVPWGTGTLRAVALDVSNNTVAVHVRAPVGPVVAVRLSLDAPNEATGTGTRLLLNGEDAALVRAEFVDVAGQVVNDANNSVVFSIVSGPARVVGTHNGDPTNHINNHSPSNQAYHGLARAVLMVTLHACGSPSERRRLVLLNPETSVVTGSETTLTNRKHAALLHPDANLAAVPTAVVVQASSPGLPPSVLTIPLSVDPADAVLAVAARSLQPVIIH